MEGYNTPQPKHSLVESTAILANRSRTGNKKENKARVELESSVSDHTRRME
jgi:hypothetical protein